MENSRGSNAVGVADLRKFKEIWQTFDIYSSGSVSHKHLKTIVQTVGEPIGRTKVSAVWFRALQAEIAAMPGSSSGEISFRNLFLILTTKMMGADALCETVDGTIETSSQQVGAAVPHALILWCSGNWSGCNPSSSG
jgi:Ca2+-binding EF-hand superfamily protein